MVELKERVTDVADRLIRECIAGYHDESGWVKFMVKHPLNAGSEEPNR